MSKHAYARRAAILLIALSIAACRTAPVLQPEIAVTTFSTEKRTEAQVADAIKRAGVERGWKIVDAGPGHLTGTLDVRKHQAVVDIAYSTTSVKIAYKDSTNLRYEDGEIHRNYNRWVNNLAESIREQLGLAK
jgi:hypothetical protein